jgi:hypothetical protein
VKRIAEFDWRGWFDLVFPAVQSDDPLNHTKLREHEPFCFVSVRDRFTRSIMIKSRHHQSSAAVVFFSSSAPLWPFDQRGMETVSNGFHFPGHSLTALKRGANQSFCSTVL